jgi:hypothetical protein
MFELELLIKLFDELFFEEGYFLADADYFDLYLDLLVLVILVCYCYGLAFLGIEVDFCFVGFIFGFEVIYEYKLD